MFKAICDPDFYYRLPWHTKTVSFSIQGLDHPDRKINIDPPLFSPGPSGLGVVEMLGNIFTVVELLVEFFSFHILFYLLFSRTAYRNDASPIFAHRENGRPMRVINSSC